MVGRSAVETCAGREEVVEFGAGTAGFSCIEGRRRRAGFAKDVELRVGGRGIVVREAEAERGVVRVIDDGRGRSGDEKEQGFVLVVGSCCY